MIKFYVCIATYPRKDGSTPEKIARCLRSVALQTYTNWKVVLVGDGYRDRGEFQKIVDLVEPGKIIFENSDLGYEREVLKLTGPDLWKSGGTYAVNRSLKLARSDILDDEKVYCHLDDDDCWAGNHLETLNTGYTMFPESVFVYTKASFRGGVLPRENVGLHYDNLPPRPSNTVHSSVSWRIPTVPLDYRNTLEQARSYPGDADMWERMAEFCKANNLKTLHMPVATVMKFDEGTILS